MKGAAQWDTFGTTTHALLLTGRAGVCGGEGGLFAAVGLEVLQCIQHIIGGQDIKREGPNLGVCTGVTGPYTHDIPEPAWGSCSWHSVVYRSKLCACRCAAHLWCCTVCHAVTGALQPWYLRGKVGRVRGKTKTHRVGLHSTCVTFTGGQAAGCSWLCLTIALRFGPASLPLLSPADRLRFTAAGGLHTAKLMVACSCTALKRIAGTRSA